MQMYHVIDLMSDHGARTHWNKYAPSYFESKHYKHRSDYKCSDMFYDVHPQTLQPHGMVDDNHVNQ